MDSRGNIHYIDTTAPGANEGSPPSAFSENAIVRQLEKRVGPIVEIPAKQLETLRNAPRRVRIAWYSDYRRALKRAKKTGRPVEVPEL